MLYREQIKKLVDRLDDRYLEIVFNIISQFLYTAPKQPDLDDGKSAVDILQEIADEGGLGIDDPVAWQKEIREDRELPFHIYTEQEPGQQSEQRYSGQQHSEVAYAI